MFQETLDRANKRVRELEGVLGRLELDNDRLHGELRAEKRSSAAAVKERDVLAGSFEKLQTKHAKITGRATAATARVSGLLLEQGETDGLRAELDSTKEELSAATADVFGLKTQLMVAQRQYASEKAKVGRLTLELDESEAARVQAEQAGREAKDRLRESETIQAELGQKLAERDRMVAAFVSVAGREN